MDVFKEQIVVKAQGGNDKMLKIAIAIVGFCVAGLCFIFTMGTAFIMFGLLAAAGALYSAYRFTTNMDVEYEYLLTNGEIDFDKIIAQRKRKRLLTVVLSTATEFGVADESVDFDDSATICHADDNTGECYYIRCKHKETGDTYVLFSPDEEMISLIKPFLPREIRNSL